MSPFCNLFGKRFFVFAKVSKYHGLNFCFFEGAYCKYDINKMWAYSKPHNFIILRNGVYKILRNAVFEILSKRCEHVTYITVRTISMIIISMKISKMLKFGDLGSKFWKIPIPISNVKFEISTFKLGYLIGEKKTGHKINRVKLLVGGNFSHLHIKLVTFPRLNFGF